MVASWRGELGDQADEEGVDRLTSRHCREECHISKSVDNVCMIQCNFKCDLLC